MRFCLITSSCSLVLSSLLRAYLRLLREIKELGRPSTPHRARSETASSSSSSRLGLAIKLTMSPSRSPNCSRYCESFSKVPRIKSLCLSAGIPVAMKTTSLSVTTLASAATSTSCSAKSIVRILSLRAGFSIYYFDLRFACFPAIWNVPSGSDVIFCLCFLAAIVPGFSTGGGGGGAFGSSLISPGLRSSSQVVAPAAFSLCFFPWTCFST
mmetsp:Transcript_34417/g.60332  ORF Transcript_34417/g.60332 Transcript_34417/m.60332 type:complete len:211 (+) Transcript_34417:5312-5944(+)